ncbi:hypothetical protein FHR75_003686 [Kineococcus radiotolerans]|uniref:Uncharacterized protein n=1 Tax=Kineococcus radiotolerans TaxID=131568 RepID=A0A7W4XZ19_KINRA|nr:hypothetical protein [Kineococcus radiotolerans]MBB2902850.1 hypothetical protein [Kineococcus radiotolerans]
MRDPRAGGGDSFYAQSGGRPVFNPGNTTPFNVPRTEAVPKPVGRNPVKVLLGWGVVLLVLGTGYRYGLPVLMDEVHAKEIAAVSEDLTNVAAGQESYKRLYGSYGADFASLSIPTTLNDITVVSAASSTYCLRGKAATGGVVLFYSPGTGVTDKACA